MKFSDRILHRIREKKDPLLQVENWIAESQSPHSAPKETLRWIPYFTKAREAKIIIFLALYRQPWEVWEIVERISKMAYNQRYTGEWKQVQDILEQVTDFDTFEDYILRNNLFDDFFGNFLRESNKFLRRNYKALTSERPKYQRKPRKSQFRRGYDDKGLLRPIHRKIWNFPDPNPGEDRRRKVQFGQHQFRKE